MNYYEKIVILNPNLEDSAVEETVERIKGVITSQGGEIIKTENWGRRKLAYELNKQSKGHYVLLFFKAPSATILELERLCKVVDAVVKFMVVKLIKKKQIEAAMPSQTESSAGTAEVKEEPAESGEAAQEGAQDVQ